LYKELAVKLDFLPKLQTFRTRPKSFLKQRKIFEIHGFMVKVKFNRELILQSKVKKAFLFEILISFQKFRTGSYAVNF
jgi:hypothetical protein